MAVDWQHQEDLYQEAEPQEQDSQRRSFLFLRQFVRSPVPLEPLRAPDGHNSKFN